MISIDLGMDICLRVAWSVVDASRTSDNTANWKPPHVHDYSGIGGNMDSIPLLISNSS